MQTPGAARGWQSVGEWSLHRQTRVKTAKLIGGEALLPVRNLQRRQFASGCSHESTRSASMVPGDMLLCLRHFVVTVSVGIAFLGRLYCRCRSVLCVLGLNLGFWTSGIRNASPVNYGSSWNGAKRWAGVRSFRTAPIQKSPERRCSLASDYDTPYRIP